MSPILHVARAADWSAAVEAGSYRWSTRAVTLDEQGFIHCSTPEQVARVASFVYAGNSDPLVVLVLSEDVVTASGIELRYEDGGTGELFPHIYGPIDLDWVTDVRPAHFDDGAFVY